jgi:hypothetical protein
MSNRLGRTCEFIDGVIADAYRFYVYRIVRGKSRARLCCQPREEL